MRVTIIKKDNKYVVIEVLHEIGYGVYESYNKIKEFFREEDAIKWCIQKGLVLDNEKE